MQDKDLPKTYKGYSTQELLRIWEQVKGEGICEDTPEEKILAMDELLREYKLSGEARA